MASPRKETLFDRVRRIQLRQSAGKKICFNVGWGTGRQIKKHCQFDEPSERLRDSAIRFL